MRELVKFVYKDGFVKRCSRMEAEVLEKLGRGKIEGGSVGAKVADKPKPVEEAAPVVAPEPVVETPAVKRRGRPAKV